MAARLHQQEDRFDSGASTISRPVKALLSAWRKLFRNLELPASTERHGANVAALTIFAHCNATRRQGDRNSTAAGEYRAGRRTPIRCGRQHEPEERQCCVCPTIRGALLTGGGVESLTATLRAGQQIETPPARHTDTHVDRSGAHLTGNAWPSASRVSVRPASHSLCAPAFATSRLAGSVVWEWTTPGTGAH